MVLAKAIRDDSGAGFGPAAGSAFRALGLPASASQAEVFEAAEALRLALRLGVEKRFEGDLAWLGPLARGEADVRDALGRLSDPPRRAAERLFWFHAPLNGPRPASVEALRGEAEAVLARGGPAAGHDAALLLLAGLHALDARFRQPPAWARAFELWRGLVDGEEFWSLLVAADLKGEFEQALTFGEAAALRARAPRLVSEELAGAAAGAVAAEDFALAGRALALLRGAALPRALVEEYENEVLGPARERAERACDEAFARSRLYADLEMIPSARKRMFDGVVHEFEHDVKPELRKLLEADGPVGFHLRRAVAHAAGWLCELAGRYREEGWTEQARYAYREAHALAPPGSAALEEAAAALRELGEEPAARAEEAYAAALARALAPRRPPAKLFPERPAAPQKDQTLTGCLLQVALYVAVVAACFALNECGIINTRRSTPTFPPGLANYNFRAPVPQFSPIPFPSTTPYSSMPTLTAAELRRRVRRGQAVVVDARPREEYAAGHIEGALSVPQDEVEGRAADLRRRGRQVVCYGSAAKPWAAQIAALGLRIHGLKNVAVLEGGFEAWVAEGLPTEASAGDDAPPPAAGRAAPTPTTPATPAP